MGVRREKWSPYARAVLDPGETKVCDREPALTQMIVQPRDCQFKKHISWYVYTLVDFWWEEEGFGE